MQIARLAAAGMRFGLLAGIATVHPPPAFDIQQNTPNPFCPGPGGEGFTTIQVATVSCPVPSRETTWGRLKTLFFGAVR